MNTPRTPLALLSALLLAATGCGGDQSVVFDNDAMTPADDLVDAAVDDDAASQNAAGLAVLRRSGCAGCHGADLAGADDPVSGSMAFASNLTPDPDTGIAAWSDEQIARAVREGVDDEGATLCATMPRYATLSDTDMAALVAYLRALPAVPHEVPASDCTAEMDGGVRPDASTDARVDVRTDTGRVDVVTVDVPRVDVPRVDVPRDVPRDVVVADAGTACHPVINELSTGYTSRGDVDWLELYNPCDASISLAGWRVGYRGASSSGSLSGTDSATIFTFSSQSIASHGYILLATMPYTGTVDGRLLSGLADSGGGVGLRNLAGTVVDSVGWGNATNAFVRGRVANEPPTTAAPGSSIQRQPDGADTRNNFNDFHVASRPTPRAANGS